MQRRYTKYDKKEKKTIYEYEIFSLKKGEIFKAEPALVNHHSEYHHVFSTVLSWSKNEAIAWQDNFSIANHCRRLLESFNAFKTPSLNGFNDILQNANNKYDIGKDVTDKLFFFLNKYSHLDRIESQDNVVENIEGEGKQITKETLSIIKIIDEVHYNSMVKLCEEKEVKSV